jgi:Na+-translocating ferredoxin:NAD+ oxidoreductase RnfG subunit
MKHFLNYAIILIAFALVSCNKTDDTREIIDEVLYASDNNKISSKSTTLTENDAIKVANIFLSTIPTKSSNNSAIENVYTITDRNGNPLIYAVNFVGNNGFLMVSATKKYYPIIAEIQRGHFDENTKGLGMDIAI